jgi:hypothetical protein
MPIILLKHRQQVMADAIAQKAAVLIAGIFAESKAIVRAIIENIGAIDREQRTDNIALAWAHTAQTGQAAAAQPVHDQRLHLIVSVVRYRNGRCAGFLGNLPQKAIAGAARSILHRAALLAGKRRNVFMPDSADQTPLGSQVSYKLRVSLACLTAYLVVKMRYMQVYLGEIAIWRAKMLENVQKAHGICPT